MDKQGLINFICEMFNIPQCNEMILRQIHKYVTERRYSYLDMARALSFYVDVQGQELELKYGIGIVPFVMDNARQYYKQLEEQKRQQLQAAEEAKKKLAEQEENTGIKIKVVKNKTIKKPHIDISEL